MRVNLMIEGQESVTWPQWQALARAADGAGLEGLFRSDHYQSVMGFRDRGSLDAWSTLAALAAVAPRLRLGTMVSPTSFRHPSVLAKAVVTADHVSGGRVELGLGAGWYEGEHRTYGFPFHDVGTRFDVFEEQLEIIVRQFREESFDFHGQHYDLVDCEANPKPLQDPLPVIIGGSGKPRSVAAAVEWAQEYNTVYATPAEVTTRRDAVMQACDTAGREPLTFSLMTGCILGEDDGQVRERAARVHAIEGDDRDFDTWLDDVRASWVVGTLDQAGERLDDLARRGVERIMLQHLAHDDLDMVALIGQLV